MSTDRDWPEDRCHENGNYYSVCVMCNYPFIGHKRRMCCKACYLAELSKRLKDDAKEFCVRIPKGEAS